MGSWLAQGKITWIGWLAILVLRQLNIPKHVAVILDGNRTFAKKNNTKIVNGYEVGSKKFSMVINLCKMLGVKEITGFIFSIENFKRPTEQISDLNSLLEKKASNLLENLEELREDGIQIRIIGEWKLLDKSIREPWARLMLETKDNKGIVVNFALAYTSRNEMLQALRDVEAGIKTSSLSINDVTVDLYDKIMKIKSTTRPVDFLIRTSGVTRLSNFMLWQSSMAVLYFTDVLWPDMSVWDALKAMYFYHRQAKLVVENKYEMESGKYEMNLEISEPISEPSMESVNRIENFIMDVETEYWKYIKSLAGNF